MAAAIPDVAFVLVLGWVSLADLRRRIVPNGALVVQLAIAVPVYLALTPEGVPGRLGWAALSGGFLLAAHLASPGGMGLGDVKLAAVIGFQLRAEAVGALFVALAAGALVGLALVSRHGPRRARSMTIPFAPFLAAGALAALGLSQPALR